MVQGVINLYKSHKELLLVEIAYFLIMIIGFMAAGFVALFNQALGVSFLVIPLIAVIASVVNVVVWSLIKTAMEHLVKLKPTAEKASEKSSEKPEKVTKKPTKKSTK